MLGRGFILSMVVAAASVFTLVAPDTEAHNRYRYDLNGNGLSDPFEPAVPEAHWGDGAGDGPGYVTLVDKTGSAWPVRASAIEWDYAGRFDVIYQYGDCGGYGHCVSVDNPRLGPNCRERAARTHIRYGSNHFSSNMYLTLNQKCADNDGPQFTNWDRRTITCHEEGHILGLDEDFVARNHRETCMAATGNTFDDSDAARKPRAHQFEMLDNRIYDHRD